MGRRPETGREQAGRRLARLNVLLVALVVLMVVGPWITRHFQAWWGAGAASGPSAGIAPTSGFGSLGSSGAPGGLGGVPGESAPTPGPGPAPVASTRAAGPPNPEGAAAREAYSLFQAGRIPEACDRYAEVARRIGAPGDRKSAGTCWGRLGRDAYQAGDAALAVQHYQRAVEVSPEDRTLWTSLAVASVKAGDLGRARAVLEDALRAVPDDAELIYLSAEVAERQGRTREAVGLLRRVLAAQPGHARARTLLASLDREERVEAGYWAQESPHFLVRYEGATGIDLGRSVVDTLEDAYSSIGRELNTYPTEKVQVGIYAAPVFGDIIGAPPHLIAGAYDGKKLRLNLASSRAYSRDLGRLVRHEYTHLLIHLASKGKAPTWLHEGLAQAMEPRSAPRLLDVSVPREALTLSGIERLSRTPDAAALVAGYSLTHVAVEFLIERGGMGAMRDLLARIGNGVSVPEALRETYGFGPDEVEARLRGVAGRG